MLEGRAGLGLKYEVPQVAGTQDKPGVWNATYKLNTVLAQEATTSFTKNHQGARERSLVGSHLMME